MLGPSHPGSPDERGISAGEEASNQPSEDPIDRKPKREERKDHHEKAEACGQQRSKDPTPKRDIHAETSILPYRQIPFDSGHRGRVALSRPLRSRRKQKRKGPLNPCGLHRDMLGTRGQMNSREALLCSDFDAVISVSSWRGRRNEVSHEPFDASRGTQLDSVRDFFLG